MRAHDYRSGSFYGVECGVWLWYVGRIYHDNFALPKLPHCEEFCLAPPMRDTQNWYTNLFRWLFWYIFCEPQQLEQIPAWKGLPEVETMLKWHWRNGHNVASSCNTGNKYIYIYKVNKHEQNKKQAEDTEAKHQLCPGTQISQIEEIWSIINRLMAKSILIGYFLYRG